MRQQKSYTVEEVISLMEHFCAYQDRCHSEVEKKLYEYRMIPEAKEKIIVHLISQNYLNEERFAKSFVRGKFNTKHWGKIKIKAALKQRNISEVNIKTAFNEIDAENYLSILTKEMVKKLTVLHENNPWKRKKKTFDYLIQKGFEYNLIEQQWDLKDQNTNDLP